MIVKQNSGFVRNRIFCRLAVSGLVRRMGIDVAVGGSNRLASIRAVGTIRSLIAPPNRVANGLGSSFNGAPLTSLSDNTVADLRQFCETIKPVHKEISKRPIRAKIYAGLPFQSSDDELDGGRRGAIKSIRNPADNHVMIPNRSLLYTAWQQLIRAYLISLTISLVIGVVVVQAGLIAPERLFEASTRRVSVAFPVFDLGVRLGVDMGVLLFGWNVLGALATMSFLYTAVFFNPDRMDTPPRVLRRIFCGSGPMKLLCYLPGCSRIEVECLRRLYVWLMVPLLGIILLGIESGLQIATAGEIGNSWWSAAVSLLPHGLIEIPTFTLAGAVVFSAHQRIRETAQRNLTRDVFQKLDSHRKAMPLPIIAGWVVGGLLVAGLVEAHVTPHLMQLLL